MPGDIIPDTSGKIDKSLIDAQVAHEQSIRYYLEHTNLDVIDEEQQAVEALIDGLAEVGLHLPGTKKFLISQRNLSSGVKGVGRVQGKEVVTAGTWPMAMFNTEKPGLWDKAMALMGRAPKQEGTK